MEFNQITFYVFAEHIGRLSWPGLASQRWPRSTGEGHLHEARQPLYSVLRTLYSAIYSALCISHYVLCNIYTLHCIPYFALCSAV